MIKRHIESTIINLLSEFRIVYLTGARQSGKTTLVRIIANLQKLNYITLDDPSVLEALSNDPKGVIQSYNDENLVLDEFQYLPSLIPVIKMVSDSLPPSHKGKFLLTGSADIFRSAKTQESLPGHMARLELYPLSISEIVGTEKNLVDYLIHQNFSRKEELQVTREQLSNWIIDGGYPEVQSKSKRSKSIWFNSYIQGRLYKDFESLYDARGDYYSRLHALIPYLAGLCGNLLKYSNLSNDLGLDDKLTKAYIQILELMFIVKRVPSFLKNRAKREATQMPKLHFVDTGLACHVLGIKTNEQLLNSQYYGGLLENFIYMELCKHAQWSNDEIKLYHFRDKQKNEVDIVLETSAHKIIGIEVKASSSVSNKDFKGLIKLAEFSKKQFQFGIVFYSGAEVLPFHQAGSQFFALPFSLIK